MSKLDISRNLGYVPQNPYIFDSTVMDNIVLGSPRVFTSRSNGDVLSNSISSDHAGTSYDAGILPATGNDVNVDNARENLDIIIRLIDAVGLTDDVIRFALDSILSKELQEKVGKALVQFRPVLRQNFDSALHDKIEMFDAGQFLNHTDIYGNLVFSDVYDIDLTREHIAEDIKFRNFLQLHQLDDILIELGYDIARQSTLLLKNLSDDPHFFKATPISMDEIEFYDTIVQKYPSGDIRTMDKADRNHFFTLALAYVPAEHKVGVVSSKVQKKILLFRKDFLNHFLKINYDQCARAMKALLAGDVRDIKPITTSSSRNFTVYCPGEYLSSRSVMENLLFGGIKTEYASAYPKIKSAIVDILKQDSHMYGQLIKIGLEFKTGSQGSKLSGGQKQKIALIRAFLKKPRILILDEATASLDNNSQKKVQSYITDHLKGNTTVLSIIHRVDLLPDYDNILVLKEGKVVEKGKYHDLLEKKGALFQLVHGG